LKTRLILFVIFILKAGILFPLFGQDKYEMKRADMVNRQIMARGIHDKHTLNAMKTVKRHLFVPAGTFLAIFRQRIQQNYYRLFPLLICLL